jgi:hypothetical protein
MQPSSARRIIGNWKFGPDTVSFPTCSIQRLDATDAVWERLSIPFMRQKGIAHLLWLGFNEYLQ